MHTLKLWMISENRENLEIKLKEKSTNHENHCLPIVPFPCMQVREHCCGGAQLYAIVRRI